MNNKILSLLGLMRKANKLVFGYDKSKQVIQSGKVDLVLVTKDISDHSYNDIKKVSEDAKTKVMELPFTKDEINDFVGKYAAIICVCDKGFSEKLTSLLED